MGNPYYIPPGEAPLSGLTRNILALSELKQRSDLSRMGMEQDAQRMAADQDYRNQTLTQNAEQQKFEKQKWERENPHLKIYGGNDHVELITTFKTLGLPNSSFIKESERLSNNPEVTKGQAYLRIRGMSGVLKKEIQDELVKKSDDPLFAGSEQAETLKGILDGIDEPGGWDAIVDQAFPEVSQVYRAQEAEAAKKNATGAKLYMGKDGQWINVNPGDPIPEGAIPESVAKQEPKNEFQVFMEGMKEIDPNVSSATIAEEWRKRQIETSKEKTQISVNLRGIAGGSEADSFKNWTPEEKQFHFDQYIKNGTRPSFAPRDISGRRVFDREVANYATGKGIDGTDIQINKADFGALKGSLNFQQKSYNMASSFANNLNGQLNKVEKLMTELNRTGIRGVDLPLRNLRTRFVGSGKEKVLESYLTEISNEIGKLSTGSQASVAELSIGAQEKWNKIHDPNLSLGELKEVLNATREQATIRTKSLRDEMANTRASMKRIGKGDSEQPASSGSPLIDYLSANKDKSSQKALYMAARKAGWKHNDILEAWRSLNGR